MRLGFIHLSSYETIIRDGKYICLNCGKTIDGRRTRYCSFECSHEFLVKNNWQALKDRFREKKDYTCALCNQRVDIFNPDCERRVIVDHIIPIRLGGPEFDENNLQVLCDLCNKAKTANDMHQIAKKRKEERILIPTQRTLSQVSNG